MIVLFCIDEDQIQNVEIKWFVVEDINHLNRPKLALLENHGQNQEMINF